MASVLVALDSFKGSISAVEACAAVGEGWSSVDCAVSVDACPLADGGEGTIAAFRGGFPTAVEIPVRVFGPDDCAVEASWLLIPADAISSAGAACVGDVGVVEVASTSGFELLDVLRPWDAHTLGFGEATAAAIDFGVERLVLGLGSSASTDGGMGFLEGLGARLEAFEDAKPMRGARGLRRVARVDMTWARRPPRGGAIALVDVRNPLCGPNGAARSFGPQKGLPVEAAEEIDRDLDRFAGLVPGDYKSLEGAGAAGGTGFAVACWGGELVSGVAAVSNLVSLDERIRQADVVVTGEGYYDAQSSGGKVPGYVRDRCVAAGVTVCLVAGGVEPGVDVSPFAATVSLSALANSPEEAISHPRRFLFEAGVTLANARLDLGH